MASTATRVMEKPTQPDPKQLQGALKCPRCDSSNTKFCYYNNYSLSQPRHFCKACKRYWTRGGTLRNVPVGGGCRKNKKIKRPISAADPPISSSSSSPTAKLSNPITTQPQINHLGNPLFDGFPITNPSSDVALPYNHLSFDYRVSSAEAVSGFVDHLQPQMHAFGLGFSDSGNCQNGFNPSSFSSLFASSTSPSIASLLGSTLHQQKLTSNINNIGSQGLVPFEELRIGGNMNPKVVKTEEIRNSQNPNCQNQMDQIIPSDHSLYWNATNIGAWLDPTNLGSSATSLI